MSVFVVHFSSPTVEEPIRRLQTRFPGTGHHKLSERTYLVRADTLAQTLAEDLEIRGSDAGRTGVVFKLNATYAGFDSSAIWEWLQLGE